MYTKKSLHGIISVHFHQRRSEFGQKLTKFDPKSWNQKESVQESIQESKRIGFSSQHQPPEPKNPRRNYGGERGERPRPSSGGRGRREECVTN